MIKTNLVRAIVSASILIGVCGCAQSDSVFDPEGHHRRLKSLSPEESSSAIAELMNTPFASPENESLSWVDVVQSINSQLRQSNSNTRVAFEISKDGLAYFRPLLTAKITSLDGKIITQSQIKDKLKGANLCWALSVVSSGTVLNTVSYKDRIVLSNYLTGD